jgi:hypothetical protein
MSELEEPHWMTCFDTIIIENIFTRMAIDGLYYYNENTKKWTISYDSSTKNYNIYNSKGEKYIFNKNICKWVVHSTHN